MQQHTGDPEIEAQRGQPCAFSIQRCAFSKTDSCCTVKRVRAREKLCCSQPQHFADTEQLCTQCRSV